MASSCWFPTHEDPAKRMGAVAMRVFVTGAFGYVGGAAAAEFERRGARITALARGEAQAARAEARGWITARGDLADVSTLLPAASTAEAVIHCAAGDGPEFDAVDAAAAPAMLDVLGPGRAFVRHGGTLVWGDTGARRHDGAEPAAPPLFLRARAAVDDALIGRAGDRRVTVACAPLVYGGTGGAIPRALAGVARALGAAAYPGDGAQVWSTVHVEDWARLIADAAERAPAGGARHVAAHGEITLRDAAAAVGAALGQPGPRAARPDELAAFGPLGLALALSQRFSGARAAEALGWTPVHPAEAPPVAEGLVPPVPD